jgi:hypothetical protein
MQYIFGSNLFLQVCYSTSWFATVDKHRFRPKCAMEQMMNIMRKKPICITIPWHTYASVFKFSGVDEASGNLVCICVRTHLL